MLRLLDRSLPTLCQREGRYRNRLKGQSYALDAKCGISIWIGAVHPFHLISDTEIANRLRFVFAGQEMAPTQEIADFRKNIDNVNAISSSCDSAQKEALAAARSLCHRLEKPMDSMLRIAWIEPSYSACLKIALDIGLFRALVEGGDGSRHSVEDIARSTNTNPTILGKLKELLLQLMALILSDTVRILRLLASMGTI